MRAGQRRHGELEGSAVGLSAIAHGWTAATSPTAGQARVPQQHGPIAAARGNDIRRGGRPAPRSRTHPLPRAYFPARRWSHGLDGAPVAHKLGQARRLSPGPAALDVPHARRVVARASHNPRVTGVAPRESKNRVAVRAPSPGGFLETATRRTQQRDTPVLVGRGEKSPADAGAGPGERKGGGRRARSPASSRGCPAKEAAATVAGGGIAPRPASRSGANGKLSMRVGKGEGCVSVRRRRSGTPPLATRQGCAAQSVAIAPHGRFETS